MVVNVQNLAASKIIVSVSKLEFHAPTIVDALIARTWKETKREK